MNKEEKILQEKIVYYRSQLEKAYKENKDFNHPSVYEWSTKLDHVITEYQKFKKQMTTEV